MNISLFPETIEKFIENSSINGKSYSLIGLDLGKNKCGIAISDDTQTTAVPLQIVYTKILTRFLESIHRNMGSFGLIVGVPLTLSGILGSSSVNVCTILDGISGFINSKNIPIWFHDERYTTRLGYSINQSKKGLNMVDDLSAMKILQEHLDIRARLLDSTRANDFK